MAIREVAYTYGGKTSPAVQQPAGGYQPYRGFSVAYFLSGLLQDGFREVRAIIGGNHAQWGDRSFRKEILSRGCSEHPMTLYKNFRGEEPGIDALLRRNGIEKN